MIDQGTARGVITKKSQKVGGTHSPHRIILRSAVQRNDPHVFCSANGLCQSALSPCRKTSLFATVYCTHFRQETDHEVGSLALDEWIESELMESISPTCFRRAGADSLSFYWRIGLFEPCIVSELMWPYMLWRSVSKRERSERI